MMNKNEIEILAPAGSFISLKAAIAAGADAVYVGGTSFGARAFANNFTEEELLEAIDYVHFHNRKIFLTVNTLLKEEELSNKLYSYLLPYYRQGIDAVIVQDIGVLKFIKTNFPDLPIHASTQMTITNVLGAKFLEEQGVERVVPARELSLSEIKEISEQTGLEIECFVHGALCYCYSGQCLLSSMIGGRSGNRGQCAQPCRLPYEVDGKKGYFISPKDICTLELIPEMIETGIHSFKIEGRMKKPEYVAAVTSLYRKYVTMYLKKGKASYHVDEKDRQALMDIYNRGGFDQGYYKKHNSADMISIQRPNHAGVPAWKVLRQKNREVEGIACVDIHKGDILELTKEDNYTFGKDIKKGECATIIVPKKKFYSKGTILFRTRNQLLLDRINHEYVDTLVKEPIDGILTLEVGKPSKLTISMRSIKVEYEGSIVENAKNQPLDKERISKQMHKTGNTEFEWKDFQINIIGNVFLPMQQLNELRRAALLKLQETICRQYRREDRDCFFQTIKEENINPILKMSVLVSTLEQLEVVLGKEEISRVYVESDLLQAKKEIVEKVRTLILENKGVQEIYIAMPPIFRKEAVVLYKAYFETFCGMGISGVLVRNYEEIQFLKENHYDKKIILDHNMYVFNSYAKSFWKEQKIDFWTAPIEQNSSELTKLGLESAEFIAYGYLPMMISAGCIKKTRGRCDHKSEMTMLKDRLGNEYGVKNFCNLCYNIMYDESPLVLYDQMSEVKKTKVQNIRLQFTMEDASVTNQIISLYAKAIYSEDKIEEPTFEFKRGHFRRGVR